MTPITKAGPEFQVNTYTFGEQSESAISALSGGGYVITWASYGQAGVGSNIYAQQYDGAGSAVGSEFKVNTDTTQDWHQTPAVSGLASGGFIITWQSYLQDGSENGIFGQRYDANGATVGGEFPVNTTTANWQWESVVTGLADGGFVVSWTTYLQDGDSAGIAGQRFDANANPMGTEFLINTHTAEAQQNPQIAALEDGGFIVTWTSTDQDGGVPAGNGYGVYAQRYDSAGAAVDTEFLVNTTTANDQAFASVAGLASGGYVITWTSYETGGPRYDILGQIYGADGLPVGDEFKADGGDAGRQMFPSVTAMPDGGFVIVWSDEEGAVESFDDSVFDIHAQRFDADGDAIGDPVLINTHTADKQVNAVITSLEDGGFSVSWQSFAQEGVDDGVFSQQFAAQSFGTKGDNTMAGGSGADWIAGLGGADTLDGLAGRDVLLGGAGNDLIDGGSDRDRLAGGSGDDVLRGGDGNDRFIGGAGKDVQRGGNGADTFVFRATSHSTNDFNADRIRDFEVGVDHIALSNLAATEFTFLGTADFSGTGPEVWAFVNGANNTILRVDADGDGQADMKIVLNGALTLTADDFIL